jgi:hypothetical protein
MHYCFFQYKNKKYESASMVGAISHCAIGKKEREMPIDVADEENSQ